MSVRPVIRTVVIHGNCKADPIDTKFGRSEGEAMKRMEIIGLHGKRHFLPCIEKVGLFDFGYVAVQVHVLGESAPRPIYVKRDGMLKRLYDYEGFNVLCDLLTGKEKEKALKKIVDAEQGDIVQRTCLTLEETIAIRLELDARRALYNHTCDAGGKVTKNEFYEAFDYSKMLRPSGTTTIIPRGVGQCPLLQGPTGECFMLMTDEDPIGKGSYKDVYLAPGLHDGELYVVGVCDIPALAIKHGDTEENIRTMLMLEAERLMALQGEGFVEVPLVHEEGDKIYFIMKRYEEGSLADAKNLNIHETLPAVREVATALVRIHDQDLIHRDIKPRNILACRDVNGKRRGALCDPGLAAGKRFDFARRRFVGTPHYLAPEIYRIIVEGDKRIKHEQARFDAAIVTGHPEAIASARWSLNMAQERKEILLQEAYSEKSDVWAFGLTLMEIFFPHARSPAHESSVWSCC